MCVRVNYFPLLILKKRNVYIHITRSLKLFDETNFVPPDMCARHCTQCIPSNVVPDSGKR
jgi:hypothetical protein